MVPSDSSPEPGALGDRVTALNLAPRQSVQSDRESSVGRNQKTGPQEHLWQRKGTSTPSVVSELSFSFSFFFFWLHRAPCGILVPQPGIEPGAPAMRGPSPNPGRPGKSLSSAFLSVFFVLGVDSTRAVGQGPGPRAALSRRGGVNRPSQHAVSLLGCAGLVEGPGPAWAGGGWRGASPLRRGWCRPCRGGVLEQSLERQGHEPGGCGRMSFPSRGQAQGGACQVWLRSRGPR